MCRIGAVFESRFRFIKISILIVSPVFRMQFRMRPGLFFARIFVQVYSPTTTANLFVLMPPRYAGSLHLLDFGNCPHKSSYFPHRLSPIKRTTKFKCLPKNRAEGSCVYFVSHKRNTSFPDSMKDSETIHNAAIRSFERKGEDLCLWEKKSPQCLPLPHLPLRLGVRPAVHQ